MRVASALRILEVKRRAWVVVWNDEAIEVGNETRSSLSKIFLFWISILDFLTPQGSCRMRLPIAVQRRGLALLFSVIKVSQLKI